MSWRGLFFFPWSHVQAAVLTQVATSRGVANRPEWGYVSVSERRFAEGDRRLLPLRRPAGVLLDPIGSPQQQEIGAAPGEESHGHHPGDPVDRIFQSDRIADR
jgi:hypothetical protein